jgi:uncharacterized repeat protein (TIGR02543 family)
VDQLNFRFNVTFNPNGGKWADDDSTASRDIPVLFPATTITEARMPDDPTRDNFNFTGWFSAATGGTPFTGTTTVTGAREVFAQWVEAGAAATIYI